MKKVLGLVVLALMLVSSVFALDLQLTKVKLGEYDLLSDTFTQVRLDRGEEAKLRVCYTANSDIKNLEIMAFIAGYEYDSISNTYGPFDVFAGDSDCIDLKLNIPKELDRSNFKIRILAVDANDDMVHYDYPVVIRGEDHDLIIDDVSIMPRDKIEAGDALYATVRVKNLGNDVEKDIKIEFSCPQLGLKDTAYVDELDPDESEVSDEMYIRVPMDTKPGKYTFYVKVYYDRDRKVETYAEDVEVYANKYVEAGEKKGSIYVATDSQTVYVGEEAIFPVVISNTGNSKATYKVKAVGVGSVDTSIAPETVFVLNPGDSRTVYITAVPKKDGEFKVVVTVSIDDQVTKDLTLTVTGERKVVVEQPSGNSGNWDNVKKGLEIGLLVLIVLLVILAIIVAFSKGGKKNEEKPETYY